MHEQYNVFCTYESYDDSASFIFASPGFCGEGSQNSGPLLAGQVNSVVLSEFLGLLLVIKFGNVRDGVRNDRCPVSPGIPDRIGGAAFDVFWLGKSDDRSFRRNIAII